MELSYLKHKRVSRNQFVGIPFPLSTRATCIGMREENSYPSSLSAYSRAFNVACF